MEKADGDRSEQVLVELARQLDRWHLTLPAMLLLEVAKPFSLIASQGLLLCQPLLGFFCDETKIGDYAEVLADRTKLERLIAALETSRAL